MTLIQATATAFGRNTEDPIVFVMGANPARIVIGKRRRHPDLAIRLLTKLAAVLVRYPNRISSLIGDARVVDDPGLNRSVMLDLRQNHLTHFAHSLAP
jgi:hypothetical protein